ncbi:MAG: ABC transporter permease [Treponema sp.]|nr:ABC transporter permease [Treponema sp.]
MTFRQLPFIMLCGKKGRSAVLMSLSLFLAFSLLCGSLILHSLRHGLRNLELRLGADIIVIPYEARTKQSIESILLRGNRTYFYMDRQYLDRCAAVDGVALISPQLFLSSVSANCCSAALQIIGFDPKTDFTIQPWIRETFRGTIDDGDLLVGSAVSVPRNRSLRFYGIDCTIVGQLAETGTGLDTAVYTTVGTIKTLIAASEEKRLNTFKNVHPDSVVSSIMIKVQDGYSVDSVADYINVHFRKVVAVKTKSMTSDIASSLAGIAKVITGIIVVIWIICLMILTLVTSLMMNERKKECAVLRAVGASRTHVARLVMAESLIINGAGGIAGSGLAVMCVIPFHTLIASSSGLPFLLPNAPTVLALVLATLFASLAAGCAAAAYAAVKISRLDTGVILREG